MVNFLDNKVFGKQFMAKRKNMECTLTKMILKGVINSDGTVDTTEGVLDKVGISDMWCYMYYLWQQNRNGEMKSFKYLENNKQLPVAKQFINSVTIFGYSTNAMRLAQKRGIAYFINHIFANYQEILNVPILAELVDKLVGRIINKEQALLLTSRKENTVSPQSANVHLWHANTNAGFAQLYSPPSPIISQYK